MQLSWYYSIDTRIICVILFLGMLAFIQLGRRIARRRANNEKENSANAAIIGSLYGLMGLLLAFTFGMSGDRFKSRKEVIVNESNAMSTAIGRIALYADSVQPQFRASFRSYLEARIRYYSAMRDTAKIRQAMNDADKHAADIWRIASSNSRIPSNLVASNQMVPALNEMFDIANTRFWGELERTPSSILTMLLFLSLTTAFMAGYTSQAKGKFDWYLATTFCFLIALVIFFIIDLDAPRKGTITLDAHERAIVNLRKMLD